jgi:hypothetical protein
VIARAAVALALLLAPSPAPSPSPSARVFTEADLARYRSGRPASSGSPSPSASSSPEPSPSPEEEVDPKKDPVLERTWRARFAEARAHVKEAEARAWKTVIEPVLVGGAGIGGMTTGKAVYVPMQVRKFEETEELRQARRALTDLEEEFRRTGLPPGWAREP